jgi:beta-mannosidase
MFAPIMISCEEVGEMTERPFCIMEPKTIEKSARLNIANETRNAIEGTVKWALRLPTGEVIKSGEENVAVPELSSVWLDKMDFSDCDELNNYLSYEFYIDQKYVSGGTCLFTAPKHFGFLNPNLTYRMEGNQIFVNADHYAKYVEIEGVDGDLKLSDNFFDINGGEVVVTILDGNATKLRIKSVYDIAN